MRIAYLAQLFPSLTMTFVYREVKGLRDEGVVIETFSTWKPRKDELSQEARGLVDSTFYIFPLVWSKFLGAHIWCFLTRPLKYLGTFLFVLTRPGEQPKNRIRTFYHFCQAVYLAKEIDRRGIRHVHVHFALNATTIALVVSRLIGVTFSFTAHANDIFENPILLGEKIAAARFIIAISQYNRQFLRRFFPPGTDLADKIHVVHCGVDLEEFAPQDKEDGSRPTILAVGRLTEKKGFPYLVKACKILLEEGYQFRCKIVGGGPQEALLQQLIVENGLSDMVSLKGPALQEELLDYWTNADFFVLPCIVAGNQDRDGIPVALMEAMAMEIPSISTSISGIPELIEDMKTGLLVPQKDEQALARAIISLLDDKGLSKRLAKAGRIKVGREFDLRANVRRLVEVFRDHLEKEPMSDASVGSPPCTENGSDVQGSSQMVCGKVVIAG